MTLSRFVPQVLPASTPSLSGGIPPVPRGAPPPPPGTLLVLAADGGYAVPPRRFTLLFGRGEGDVHVPVGTRDPYVSRVQGHIEGDGTEWWIHNRGSSGGGGLPIRRSAGEHLLAGHEAPLPPGYTPLLVGHAAGRSYLLEVRVIGHDRPEAKVGPSSRTRLPPPYDLTETQHMVVTMLAQRYLRQERYPQPVAWRQLAADLNRVQREKVWTERTAANEVAAVREKLADAVPGLLRDDHMVEPLGNILNHNLVQAVLENGTVTPEDLALLVKDED